VSLPDDLGSALMDGVVLCHLANHVRPRSVASIHVPSPAVPKLTVARCRRNVENFIEACRRIGVTEVSFVPFFLALSIV
jgi:sirohydrochlorin ferrochelatase